MNRKAGKILKDLYPKFPEWSRDFREFLGLFYPDIRIPQPDKQKIWESIEDTYAAVLESIIRMSGINDRWEGPAFIPLAVKTGLEVHYRSLKLECPFIFGTDQQGFFLSADLLYSEMIRKMDDNFWYQMAELTRFGKLDLWEHRAWPETLVRKEPWFHRKSGSRIFQIIRSSVALEKEDGSADGLGMIIIRWNYDT